MNKIVLSPLILIAFILSGSTAWSDNLFTVQVTANGQTEILGFNDAEESFDSFDEDALKAQFSDFDKETDGATATIDYRGLPMIVTYAENSSEISFQVPGLNINQSFNDGDRDTNLEDLKDFISEDGGDVLNRINKALVAVSANDPVAGNPDSLMSQMVDQGFIEGFSDNQSTSEVTNITDTVAIDNQIALGLRFGKYTVNDHDVQTFGLPLSYSIRFDGNPKHQLRFSMPLQLTKTESAEAYRIGLGIAYSYPVGPRWSLTPAVSYGVVGSVNLGSVGAILGSSVTSRYTWQIGADTLALGNMVGIFQTQELKFNEYKINPEISNTVLKNGLIYRKRISKKLAMSAILTDTRFSGDELYVEQANEIGVSFGPNNTGKLLLDSYARLGLTYMWTDQSDINGLRLNFGVSF